MLLTMAVVALVILIREGAIRAVFLQQQASVCISLGYLALLFLLMNEPKAFIACFF